MKMIMTLGLVLGLVGAGFGLVACETVKGAGTDLQRASEAVQKKF